MYTASQPQLERLFSEHMISNPQLTRQQPYYHAKAFPLLIQLQEKYIFTGSQGAQ